MEAFAAQKAELERTAAEKLADAQRRAEKLEGNRVTVRQKAGVDGRLFGSVTNADIADALKAQGHEVVKAEVRLPEGPFKAIGEYSVVLALHTDVTANVTVVVTGEQ
jgi:large subunit ribosomal protein L9